MRYRLRTLLIALAVVPPVASLVWWLFETGLLPPNLASVPIVAIIAAITAVAINWICELADYLEGRRQPDSS